MVVFATAIYAVDKAKKYTDYYITYKKSRGTIFLDKGTTMRGELVYSIYDKC
jgi:hypothetical protein